MPDPTLVRLAGVLRILNVSRRHLYTIRETDPTFPRPVFLTPGLSTPRWRVSEIDSWVESKRSPTVEQQKPPTP